MRINKRRAVLGLLILGAIGGSVGYAFSRTDLPVVAQVLLTVSAAMFVGLGAGRSDAVNRWLRPGGRS